MSTARQFFRIANPHALAAIVAASRSRAIVASHDILDEDDVTLWSRDQPVSDELPERVRGRRLKYPLEACLRATDGVTVHDLHEAFSAFIESDLGLARAVRPWAKWLGDHVKQLPLHTVAQLMLTVAQAGKPSSFDHAVRGMALAGAMSASAGDERRGVRLAMLGGLLHDVAEMYIPPQYLDASEPFNTRTFRHVAVHPRIGELVLGGLTNYPAALARAVGEHHERLNGSGYPSHRTGNAISPLGKLLAVVETTLGVASTSTAPCARSSLALRLIPGEFDRSWEAFIEAATHRAHEDLAAATMHEMGDALDQVELMDAQLALAAEQAVALEIEGGSASVTHIATRAHRLLDRLRSGWNEMGFSSVVRSEGATGALFEIQVMRQELRYRMRSIQRECLWSEVELSPGDSRQLEPLWAFLTPSGRASATA